MFDFLRGNNHRTAKMSAGDSKISRGAMERPHARTYYKVEILTADRAQSGAGVLLTRKRRKAGQILMSALLPSVRESRNAYLASLPAGVVNCRVLIFARQDTAYGLVLWAAPPSETPKLRRTPTAGVDT